MAITFWVLEDNKLQEVKKSKSLVTYLSTIRPHLLRILPSPKDAINQGLNARDS